MPEPTPRLLDPYQPDYLPPDEHLDPFDEEPVASPDTATMSQSDRGFQRRIEQIAPEKKELFTAQQEQLQALLIQNGLAAKDSLKSARLTVEKKTELKRKAELGDKALDTLVESNLRLAAWFVRETMDLHKGRREAQGKPGLSGTLIKYWSSMSGGSLDYAERMQLASIGVYKAALTYSGKVRFSTWAVYSMESELLRAMSVGNAQFHIPEGVRGDLRRYEQGKDELTQKLQHTPTIQELEKHLELSAADVSQFERLLSTRQHTSYEELRNSYDGEQYAAQQEDPAEENVNLADRYADTGTMRTVADDALIEVRNKQLDTVLGESLNSREEQVIGLRYGLFGGDPMTLEEVGKEFGVQRERIRQIESKTLAKLRSHPDTQQLRDYWDDPDDPRLGRQPELRLDTD